ncbi:MAG: methyltransferase domain-containing protein [Sideroxydans sp.]|nr:methyltransferase domain-containing protein [Sideroxydans sp.]
MTNDPASYDAWYETARGHWIGEAEFRLLSRLLRPQPDESVLDVGCGSGYFARRFAQLVNGGNVTGLDADHAMLAFARTRDSQSHYIEGDAQALPFPDRTFDCVVSIAALCFVENEQRALAEILRVSRSRFAVAWLDRTSLLYRHKGQDGGTGGYRGARWHTAREIRHLFTGMPIWNLKLTSAIFLPNGNFMARAMETLLPDRLLLGSLLVASGRISPDNHAS